MEPERGFEPTNLPITNRLRCHCATRACYQTSAFGQAVACFRPADGPADTPLASRRRETPPSVTAERDRSSIGPRFGHEQRVTPASVAPPRAQRCALQRVPSAVSCRTMPRAARSSRMRSERAKSRCRSRRLATFDQRLDGVVDILAAACDLELRRELRDGSGIEEPRGVRRWLVQTQPEHASQLAEAPLRSLDRRAGRLAAFTVDRSRVTEQPSQRARRREVVLHRLDKVVRRSRWRPRRGSRATSALVSGGGSKRVAQSLDTGGGGVHRLVGEVVDRAILAVQHEQPDRVGPPALEGVLDGDHVSGRLRHLLVVALDHPVVHPEPCERLGRRRGARLPPPGRSRSRGAGRRGRSRRRGCRTPAPR